MLAQLDGFEARRHLAIARLATSFTLDGTYDIVLGATDAQNAALAAVNSADLDQLTEIWYAAPHLGRHLFLGPYLAAVLTIHTAGQEGHDHARQLITTAAQLRQQLDHTTQPDDDGQLTRLRQQVNTAPTQLHHLADNHPTHAEILRELAELLTTADTSTSDQERPADTPET